LISANLVGEFNVYNMLAAAAVAHIVGIEGEAIKDGLESVTNLIGRMQSIDQGQPFQVVVDFAHTPNALQQAVKAARRMASGRIITVFGSAGKRDVEKRLLMAEVSALQADLTVLTAEDPRTESLDEILSMMAEGCRHRGAVEGETFWRIHDRGRAIYFALGLAEVDDLVLICGKGHEQSMCFGTIEYPWNDIDATRMALEAFLSGRPTPDLGLPTFDLH
jgi:UDP-N-acetylmuramoyl-L-alanyl-D-glutamate--2,6-diaminopimelate ligase